MPPPGGSKRKRGDRTYSEDDVNRPSPHRPANLELARQHQPHPHSPTYNRNGQDGRGRGNRRSSRGGRNNFETSRSNYQNTIDVQPSTMKSAAPEFNASEPVPSNTRSVPDQPRPTPLPIEPASVFRPYMHVHLTKEVCEKWQAGGKLKIQEQLKDVNQSGNEIEFLAIVQELIRVATSKQMPALEAGGVLRAILTSEIEDENLQRIQTTILDALSIAFEDNQSLQREPLAEFIHATGIEEDLLRQEFDQDLLQKLGMIRSTFGRMGIRKQTNILYRQANFNLMREESEGFAKLMTELFTTSGNEPPTGEVVEDAVEHVKAMIGAFDLDVGRSLDVVLDVFGAVLVKQFRFFVKFLRASPWWPRAQDTGLVTVKLGGLPRWAQPGVHDWKLSKEDEVEVREATRRRDCDFWPQARKIGLRAFQQVGRTVVSETDLKIDDQTSGDDVTQTWIRETGTLPVSANRDAAQLLGFKLRFYSSSEIRDTSDTLPDHLIYLSALLIKIGFISLNDLYPHIWRSDDEMEELRLQKVKEKAERERAARPGAGARNALLMAGALADDTLPAPTRLREPPTRSGTPAKEIELEKPATKDISSEPLDQKVLLLKSLLAIGALPEALFILGRFPWIIDLCPEVPEYINRILHHSLSHVYDTLRPLQSRESLQDQKPFYETDLPGVPKGQVRLTAAPQKRVLRWAQLNRNDSNDGTDYRFYWDEWHDNIPICQDTEDVFTLCQTILPLVGVKIGQDSALVLKLTRIGKRSLIDDSSERNRSRWLDLIKRVLLPCLSLTKPNAGVINEVFDFISTYPTSVRYDMYIEWSSGRISRNPDVKSAFDQAKAETKDILKRISKTNIKPMARSLAKIAYANPHVVITTALAQIEVYDSIAEVFVEGSRYFTDLGYDVLNWALISSMARAGRSRVQEGGMFTSRWLQALSQFAGKIYKRYSMMKPGPVLQYVSEQLNHGNSTDLKMLEQIVAAMAGIATDTSFNDAQLQAMGGGPLLQSQTILQLLDRRNDSRTSSRRLVKALQDHGLISKFLLSMAQQRQACVFEEGDVPLKAIGNTFDEINRIMYQYLDLLRSNLSVEEFQQTIPDVARLLVDYEIPVDVAFWITRPVLAKQMTEIDSDSMISKNLNEAKLQNTDIDMKDPESSEEEDGEAVETEEVATTAATPSEFEINEVIDIDSSRTTHVPENWNPVLKLVMDQIQDHLPQKIVDTIGVGFYVTFWQLSLYDINVPSKSYEDEMNRQRRKISAITADRTNISASGAKMRENSVRQHQQIIDDLLAENKDHLKSYSESRSRLQREKDHWFAKKQRQSTEINTALMEYCFLPRTLSSPQDALFCFRFVKFLQSTGTPNFRTLGFYDAFFKPDRLASLIFMCSSKESDNLGRFLCELLRDLGRWHKDRSIYEREAFGSKKQLPGFAMKVENGKPQLLLDFENFRRILFKWHSNLYSALVKCLSSPEYMHIRNAISILRAVSPVYPAVNFHGTALRKAVTKLGDSNREDLTVASAALQGALCRREKEWLIPQAFRQGQGLEKTDVNKAVVSMQSTEEESKEDDIKNEEEGEAVEAPTSVPSKVEVIDKKIVLESRPRQSPNPVSVEAQVERIRSSTGTEQHVLSRPPLESVASGRRSVRVTDSNRSHELPRKLSPSRHQSSPGLPSRPDLDSRNGHRDSSRANPRLPPIDPPRPDSRTSHGRYGQHERNQDSSYDQSHRHPRQHDRPVVPEREERSSRRDHEARHGYDERLRPERDGRLERDSRSEHSRGADREPRLTERDVPRPTYEPSDRRRPERPERPDLLDERRSAPSASSRNALTPPVPSSVNPERAGLIINPEQRSGMSIRGQAQDKSKGSRAPSPRREEERRQARLERDDKTERSDRQERSDRSEPIERSERAERGEHTDRAERNDRAERFDRAERPERYDRSERSDRTERPERVDRRQEAIARQPPPVQNPSYARPGAPTDFGRDSRPYNQPSIDMQHGRLEPESPNHPPPRERALPEPEIPSGPRSRVANGSRRGPAPSPVQPPVPAPERAPPTGPSKHARGNSSFEPTPPVAPSDTSSVHPDRMNLVSAQEVPRPPPQRLPPVNTQVSPPSGPRNGPAVPPSGPSPSTRGPPSGPQIEGVGRGRRHPLAAVNSTLAQASGPGGRGRGGPRQSGQFQQLQSPQTSRPDFTQSDPSNPNGVPVQPRPQSSRRESGREVRNEVDPRQGRNRHDGKEGNRTEEPRRNDRRDEVNRDQRGYGGGPQEELQPRKHHREDSGPYPSGPSRGGRSANDSKRPRRGAS